MLLSSNFSRVMIKTAAPSPRLMPSRLTESGLERLSDNTDKEEKPLIVRGESSSTPPQITASHKPAFNKRAALIKAFAPEVQAVEIP